VAFEPATNGAAPQIVRDAAQRKKPYAVSRCLLCGSPSIQSRIQDRVVTTKCGECSAILAIEFDPPDAPGIRARIERLDDPPPLSPD
jgi:hypothetical protein